MPPTEPRKRGHPVGNNTVKLTDVLRDRVLQAMQVGGFTVWSEFCRVALREKCQLTEERLRGRDLAEYTRLYVAGGSRASPRARGKTAGTD